VTVLEASHGKEAFSVLENHKELPDLILLDLLMPVMNGFEFLQQLQITKFKSIPVLVLTGADLSSEEREILSQETLRVIEKNTESVALIADDIAQAIETISGAVR
jgi:CheY-like chemotaxis protein